MPLTSCRPTQRGDNYNGSQKDDQSAKVADVGLLLTLDTLALSFGLDGMLDRNPSSVPKVLFGNSLDSEIRFPIVAKRSFPLSAHLDSRPETDTPANCNSNATHARER